MPGWIRALVAGGSIALLQGCSTSASTSLNPNAPAARCSVTATAQPASVGAPGGSGAVIVSTNRECAWEASSESGWLSLGQSRTGQGDGTVTWAAAANPGVNERRGAIVVNGTRIDRQAPADCAFAIDRRRRPRTPPVAATTLWHGQGGCVWSARSDRPGLDLRGAALAVGRSR